MASVVPPSSLPLRAKLWRYVSYGWLLERPSQELFSAYAARRSNRERLARWLPHYLRVYAVWAALAALARSTAQALDVDAVTQVLCSFSLCAAGLVGVSTGCAYLALRLGERFRLYD